MVWNSNENWRPKSVFLAFTTTKECEGKVIIKTFATEVFGSSIANIINGLDFQFGKNEEDFMEFRKEIGLVSRIPMIHWSNVIIFLVQKSFSGNWYVTTNVWQCNFDLLYSITWSLKLKRLTYLISLSSALYDRNPNFHIIY